MTMHVLVTGVSGFLGRHVAGQALSRGYKVTAMARPGDKRKYEGIGVIEKDLVSDHSLSESLKGVDVVVHCAADTNLSPRRSDVAWTFNTLGTRNLVQAAKAVGVKRFIFVSTAGTIGNNGSRLLPYVESKIETERMLLDEFQKNNFPAVIVNPSFILGPGDMRSGSTRLIKHFVNNRIIVHTGGGKDVVDVRDVATAILNAVTMGKAGAQYVLSNRDMSYREIIDVIDGSLKRTALKIKMPNLFWALIGYSGTAVSFLRRDGPTLNHLTMKLAVGRSNYSSAAAKAELNFCPRPAAETIIETVNWLKDKR